MYLSTAVVSQNLYILRSYLLYRTTDSFFRLNRGISSTPHEDSVFQCCPRERRYEYVGDVLMEMMRLRLLSAFSAP